MAAAWEARARDIAEHPMPEDLQVRVNTGPLPHCMVDHGVSDLMHFGPIFDCLFLNVAYRGYHVQRL